jgi:rRNA maturation endonuclease Nob1
MAVLIKFGSGVVTAGATQARATINNIKTKKRCWVLLTIFPSFCHECGGALLTIQGSADACNRGSTREKLQKFLPEPEKTSF